MPTNANAGAPQFARARVAYPPRRVTLVGLKAERTLQVWVSGDDGRWSHLRDYPALGMSGVLGRSVGCLAMGDEAAEDLFVLAAESGIDNVSVILAPVDFRARDLPEPMPELPPWAGELYDAIKAELQKLAEPTGA